MAQEAAAELGRQEPRRHRVARQLPNDRVRVRLPSVRRDLEWLLNTRYFYDPGDGVGLEETIKSVAFYGMPDFTGASAKSHIEQTRMTQALEAALKHFEPRFINVKVSLEPISNLDRLLKFRIEASLDVEPAPEPVVFDTVLQMGSGNFAVKEG